MNRLCFSFLTCVIVSFFPTPSSADYSSTVGDLTELVLSDSNAIQYESLAQPFFVTAPTGDTINSVIFFGGCMGSNSPGCISTNRLTVTIRSSINGLPNAVLYKTNAVVGERTGRQFYRGVFGFDPTEQMRELTTDEIKYAASLGETKLSPGVYFLEISGSVHPTYAWGWEVASYNSSALAVRFEAGAWTNALVVANGGVNCGDKFCFGGMFYDQSSQTLAYQISSSHKLIKTQVKAGAPPPPSKEIMQPAFQK